MMTRGTDSASRIKEEVRSDADCLIAPHPSYFFDMSQRRNSFNGSRVC